jgi:anti-sigma B factor antagonist
VSHYPGGLDLMRQGDVVLARVTGPLDVSNAEDLRRTIAAQLDGSAPGLVVDLSEVTYLDSSGIELLFDLGRRLRTRRQRLGLVVPDPSPVRRVVDLANLASVALVCETLDAAVEGVRASD